MSVKLRLKEVRKSRRLTQAQVAEGVNCSASTLSRYETGKRQPPLDMLVRLADFFDVSLDYIFGRTPPDSSALSSYEKDMLESFRNVPDTVQDDIVDFLNLRQSKKETFRK